MSACAPDEVGSGTHVHVTIPCIGKLLRGRPHHDAVEIDVRMRRADARENASVRLLENARSG